MDNTEQSSFAYQHDGHSDEAAVAQANGIPSRPLAEDLARLQGIMEQFRQAAEMPDINKAFAALASDVASLKRYRQWTTLVESAANAAVGGNLRLSLSELRHAINVSGLDPHEQQARDAAVAQVRDLLLLLYASTNADDTAWQNQLAAFDFQSLAQRLRPYAPPAQVGTEDNVYGPAWAEKMGNAARQLGETLHQQAVLAEQEKQRNDISLAEKVYQDANSAWLSGNPDEARRLLKHAAALDMRYQDPNRLDEKLSLLDQIGRYAAELRYDDAARSLNQLQALDRSLADQQRALLVNQATQQADGYAQRNQPSEARRWLGYALALDPYNQTIQTRLQSVDAQVNQQQREDVRLRDALKNSENNLAALHSEVTNLGGRITVLERSDKRSSSNIGGRLTILTIIAILALLAALGSIGMGVLGIYNKSTPTPVPTVGPVITATTTLTISDTPTVAEPTSTDTPIGPTDTPETPSPTPAPPVSIISINGTAHINGTVTKNVFNGSLILDNIAGTFDSATVAGNATLPLQVDTTSVPNKLSAKGMLSINFPDDGNPQDLVITVTADMTKDGNARTGKLFFSGTLPNGTEVEGNSDELTTSGGFSTNGIVTGSANFTLTTKLATPAIPTPAPTDTSAPPAPTDTPASPSPTNTTAPAPTNTTLLSIPAADQAATPAVISSPTPATIAAPTPLVSPTK